MLVFYSELIEKLPLIFQRFDNICQITFLLVNSENSC
jgi:hypothetical protein